MQIRGAYKHKNTRIVSLPIIFVPEKNIEDNHLSTLTFVICRLPVT